MARLRDQLPQRLSDPLFNIKHHVARRTGMVDPVREKRKRREQERQPRVEPGLPREVVDVAEGAPYAPLAHSHAATVVAQSAAVSVTAGTAAAATVACAAGQQVTGGGWSHDGDGTVVYGTYSAPSGNGWTAAIFNGQAVVSVNLTVFAMCQESPIT